jgi:hypothetical protein
MCRIQLRNNQETFSQGAGSTYLGTEHLGNQAVAAAAFAEEAKISTGKLFYIISVVTYGALSRAYSHV